MDARYIGVDMQRTRSFPDWHAYDKAVLQHNNDLGGTDEPDWRPSERLGLKSTSIHETRLLAHSILSLSGLLSAVTAFAAGSRKGI